MGRGHPECPERLDAIEDRMLASRLLGGSQADEARAIALAPDGSVSLAGMTSSFNWYRVNAFQSSYGGGNLDGVIFRFTLP